MVISVQINDEMMPCTYPLCRCCPHATMLLPLVVSLHKPLLLLSQGTIDGRDAICSFGLEDSVDNIVGYLPSVRVLRAVFNAHDIPKSKGEMVAVMKEIMWRTASGSARRPEQRQCWERPSAWSCELGNSCLLSLSLAVGKFLLSFAMIN